MYSYSDLKVPIAEASRSVLLTDDKLRDSLPIWTAKRSVFYRVSFSLKLNHKGSKTSVKESRLTGERCRSPSTWLISASRPARVSHSRATHRGKNNSKTRENHQSETVLPINIKCYVCFCNFRGQSLRCNASLCGKHFFSFQLAELKSVRSMFYIQRFECYCQSLCRVFFLCR